MANKTDLLKDQSFVDGVLKASSKEDVIAQFQAHGLELTAAQIDAALASAKAPAKGGELSNEDLDTVAGGGFFGDFWEGFKIGFTKPVTGVEILIQAAKEM